MAVIKFLVVDDATFIRDLLKKNIRDHFPGSEILDAPGAKKAQLIMKSNQVDIILCDWEMPEMTGEEFLLWVRAQEQYANLPFIMVTSRGERDYIVKAAQAGVSDYLGKPFKPEDLVNKVSKALAKVGIKVKASGVPDSSDSSVGILTAGASPAAKKTSPPTKSPLNDSANVLTAFNTAPTSSASPAAEKNQPSTNKTNEKTKARGQALLTFSSFNSQCVIQNISLKMLSGAIKRQQTLPAIFDSVVISIVQNDGEDVARLNGYVHSIQAAENNVEAGVLKLVIRFVDDDPVKLEQLSRYIGTL